jgi:putative Holliday junction resolvase
VSGQGAHRILALDVGSKRIGMAVSDELGVAAHGIETLERRDRKADLAFLGRVIKKHGIAEVVVGHPVHMTGGSSPSAERSEKFAAFVREKFGLPVHLLDERLTSWEAEQRLRESGRPQGDVDQESAIIILESYLSSRKSHRPSK